MGVGKISCETLCVCVGGGGEGGGKGVRKIFEAHMKMYPHLPQLITNDLSLIDHYRTTMDEEFNKQLLSF